jgi:hypothetical protein
MIMPAACNLATIFEFFTEKIALIEDCDNYGIYRITEMRYSLVGMPELQKNGYEADLIISFIVPILYILMDRNSAANVREYESRDNKLECQNLYLVRLIRLTWSPTLNTSKLRAEIVAASSDCHHSTLL